MKINTILSLYLDSIRISAAMVIFLFHGAMLRIGNGSILETLGLAKSPRAHLAVIAFFVLSGFLIQHSAQQPGTTARKFVVDRLGRLSSVVYPALILTFVATILTYWADEATYRNLVTGAPAIQAAKFAATAVYLSQIWILCTPPGFNGPFWSLGYELWYYAILGIFTFSSGRKRLLLLLGVALLVGPNVLLLLPAWLAGAFSRAWAGRLPALKKYASAVWILSTLLVALCIVLTNDLPGWSKRISLKPLYFSSNFLWDDLFGLLLACNLWALAAMNPDPKWSTKPLVRRFITMVSAASGMTFSLYLYHVPLLVLIGVFGSYDRESTAAFLGVLAFTLILVALLAQLTEKKVDAWRHFVSWVLRALQTKRLLHLAK